jgi:hypothetical protein
MVSSGMLRRVALIRTDVSEEPGASFIRVTRIGELGTTLAVTSNRRMLRRNGSIPEDTILHSHRRGNLKSLFRRVDILLHYLMTCSVGNVELCYRTTGR